MKRLNNVNITIIIPVFNSEKYIKFCLSDLLKQSYPNFEVILVDDGSTDNSLKICNNFCELDNRIKVITQKNGGVSKARNTGLKMANGKYICFVDSDDRVDKNYLKDLIESYYACNSVADLVIHGCKIDYYKKEKIVKTKIIEPKSKIYKFQEFLASLEEDIPLVCAQTVWGKLYLKSIIEENSVSFNEKISLSEDYLFNLEYMNCIDNIVIEAYSNYHYRKTEINSLVRRYHPEYLDTIKTIIFKMEYVVKQPSDKFLGYIFREYARTIYHYYSNFSYNEKKDRIDILKKLETAPLFKKSLCISHQPSMYKIIRLVLLQNNITLSNIFFSITSLLRRY